MVPMDLDRIVIFENREQQFVYLREREGTRTFPIVIGLPEAAAIDRKVRDVKPPRPLTHDLLVSVVAALGGTVKAVVVHKLEEHTFFAKLVVEHDGREIEIDSRPSDAIAVASHTHVPIFVDESVLDEVATDPEPEDE